MLINEYIGKSDKNHMISTLLKYYGVSGVKIKEKSMKDHAHYNVDTGTLELSTRYKKIRPSQIKEFLITIIHEIDHAMDAKKKGWKNFKADYEWEMNYQIGQGKDKYDDNKYEIKAEKFGQKNWKRWYAWFKKENII
tara:strand:+ start:1766 stop:2176 length:411 start_codon:yes stop_codon:yes gene_type:complete